MVESLTPMDQAIWVAKSLFDRGKTSGSTANLSFRHQDGIYITGSGTCFGFLTPDSFALIDETGAHAGDIAPSKEYPLHTALYKQRPNIQAIIHTHSFYSVLWSCLPHENHQDVIPAYTPYLRMRLGSVCLVPYAPPGSEELFALFSERISNTNGYLLANHGPIAGGSDILSAFYALEEFEEGARIAWSLRNESSANTITL